MRRRGVRSVAAYLLGPGVLSWAGLFTAHLHPALALVAVVPFMPSAGHDEGLFAETDDQPHTDTLNRFEHAFKAPVDFGLFAFGLANAGVALTAISEVTWAVVCALLVGKTCGILLMGSLAHALGFPLPTGMNHRSLLLAGMTAGLGLTVALFVAGVAFADPALANAAKMGALLSAGIAPLVVVLGRLLRVRELAAPPQAQAKQHPSISRPVEVV